MALEKIDIETLDPKRTIVVATGNAHKLTEIEAILSQVLPDVRFVALGQLGDFEDPEENGTTFVENAIIKAEAAVAATGLAAIADDSGLVVDALNGEPGVYSARYAGTHGDDEANNAKLLDKMQEVADADRTARFMSVVALIDAAGCVLTGTGAWALAMTRCSCPPIRPARPWPSSRPRRRTPSAIASMRSKTCLLSSRLWAALRRRSANPCAPSFSALSARA